MPDSTTSSLPVEEIRDGIWSFRMPFTDESGDTCGYIVAADDGSVCVIDPGWHSDANLERLKNAVAATGHRPENVSAIAVTHLHVDHIGLAPALRDISGADILLHPADQRAILDGPAWRADGALLDRWGVPESRRVELMRYWGEARSFPPVTAQSLLDDGDLLPVGGRRIRAVWTPGHTAGHLCFVDADDGLVFTGDHVLPQIHPGIGLGGAGPRNPLTDYLDSLEKIAAHTPAEAMPGHGRPIPDLAERCRRLDEHHRSRMAEVADALDRLTAPTLWQVAASIRWYGGWEAMGQYRLGSALAQTGYHIDALERTPDVAGLTG